MLYALKEGDICEHSCACESRLYCFRDAAPDVNGKPKVSHRVIPDMYGRSVIKGTF